MPSYAPDELVEILYPYLGGLRFTPGYYSSTSWDGDAKAFDSSGIIDLSAVFGVPAGVKAVSVRMSIQDETVEVIAVLSSTSVILTDGVIVRTQVADVYSDIAGIVRCDANGDIYFTQNGELDNVYLYITGYWS